MKRRYLPCAFILAGLTGLAGCLAPVQRTAPPVPLVVAPITRPGGETPEWWFRAGAATAQRLRGDDPATARNVILFLGDGMGISTITAARILEGQRKGASGEENLLAFEEFPHTALSRTYEVDAQTAESAGTMSAIMAGVKTRFGVIAVNQRARRRDCASAAGNETVTALELAAWAGLGTGIVTTTRVTHATPAATYAHSPERNWEHDAAIPAAERAHGCADLASQLVGFPFGGGIDVVLGGGRSRFLPVTSPDPEYPHLRGRRHDGRDLIAEWLRVPGSRHVWNGEQFAALDPARAGRVLGLFEPEHMRYAHDRANDPGGEPSLAAMTRKAIELLRRKPKGYFLVVEGGRIDHAHHASNAFRALDETIAFSDAVRVASAMTPADDTLILVTADHSHTLTIAGYPVRGNPILGKLRGTTVEGTPNANLARGLDARPYTTLGYANGSGGAGPSNLQGPGPKRFPHEPARMEPAAAGRADLESVDTGDPDYLQESLVPLHSETHGGEDVAVFARGPGAAAVRGSIEQNVLFHLMVQGHADLRAALCRLGSCTADGIPANLPDYARLPRPEPVGLPVDP